MDPASSSDDDNSSSSSSVKEDDYTRAKRRAEIEPVDSSEDDGSSDDGEYNNYDDDGDLQDLQDINDIQQLQEGITNFNDLPTDDSEDDSDSDSSSDGDAKQHAKSYDSEEEEGSSDDDEQQQEDEEDVPISERVASKAQLGRRYYTGDDNNTNADNNNDVPFDDSGKKRRAERKSRAIERLREVLKKDKKKKKQQSSTTSSDDDNSDNVEQATSKQDTTTTTTKKKKSKHAPTEMSSKRRDYFSRGRPDLNSSGIGISIGANKYKPRDPRMTSLSGHYDENIFDKRYSFLEEVQEKEIKQLKLRINAWKQSGKKGQRLRKRLGINATSNDESLEVDQEELTRLLQQRAERKRSQVVRSAKKIVKQKIQEDVASGKRGAYYPKRSELKRMEAEAKYMEIRKRGGEEAVDKAIAKRRKKNMSKVAKSMPNI